MLLKADDLVDTIEDLSLEINFHYEKWLISVSYKLHLDSIQNYLLPLSKKFDLYSSNYENFIALGNFKAKINTHMGVFFSIPTIKIL